MILVSLCSAHSPPGNYVSKQVFRVWLDEKRQHLLVRE